jgi:hypothetical protein
VEASGVGSTALVEVDALDASEPLPASPWAPQADSSNKRLSTKHRTDKYFRMESAPFFQYFYLHYNTRETESNVEAFKKKCQKIASPLAMARQS